MFTVPSTSRFGPGTVWRSPDEGSSKWEVTPPRTSLGGVWTPPPLDTDI